MAATAGIEKSGERFPWVVVLTDGRSYIRNCLLFLFEVESIIQSGDELVIHHEGSRVRHGYGNGMYTSSGFGL